MDYFINKKIFRKKFFDFGFDPAERRLRLSCGFDGIIVSWVWLFLALLFMEILSVLKGLFYQFEDFFYFSVDLISLSF